MSWPGDLKRKRGQDSDMDREIAFHVEQLERDHLAQGMRPEEARRRALVEFGGREQAKQQMREIAASVQPEEVPDDNGADLSAMFDQINSLPADDPLRQPATAAAMQQNQIADERAAQASASAPPPKKGILGLSNKVLSTFHANGDTTSVISDTNTADNKPMTAPQINPTVQARGNGAVIVDAGHRVAVPEFRGSALRTVVENATNLGLRVETLGSGLARDQMPAPGTMVPPGTEVVVRFAR